MLHHFVIKVHRNEIDQVIERLNAVGIYYIHYEEPISVTTTEFGYGLEKKEETELELNIYAEEGDAPDLPTTYFASLQEVLSIPRQEIRYFTIEDENWQQPFEDIDLGNGWVICTPGSVQNYGEKNNKIVLDPQGAFGTGLHGTTQDCLRMILKRNFTGEKVADLGSGSGILSLAARLKGALSVTAIDLQPVEREIRYNASLNGLTEIEVIQQDILQTKFSIDPYTTLFINIGGEETLQFVSENSLLKSFNGNYLISGLVEWSVERVLTPFYSANYRVEERLQTDEWVTVYLMKNS